MLFRSAKVIENTQRDVNIALVNELALIFNRLDIDTEEVLAAAGTKWNFLPFKPGLVGGHCIGVDPYYLTHKAEAIGYHPEMILAGRRLNDNMAAYAASQIVKLMIRKTIQPAAARVLMLGLTFKENCPDLRNSRVIDVVRELESYGAKVHVHDPVAIPAEAAHEYGIKLAAWSELPQAGAIVAAVAHGDFRRRTVSDYVAKLLPGGVFVDVKGQADAAALRAAWGRTTVLAIGPGLGQGRWARGLLAAAMESPLPKVIDADALNLIAAEPLRREDWILTPHPGEAARMLGIDTAQVQGQRFEALRALLERYGGVCVLKGSGTLVGQSAGADVWLCDVGNPGMASGGMGDVLTGVIAALLAQGMAPFDAARLAVWVHATAADDAARVQGEIGLLASDLLPHTRRRLNELAAHVG